MVRKRNVLFHLWQPLASTRSDGAPPLRQVWSRCRIPERLWRGNSGDRVLVPPYVLVHPKVQRCHGRLAQNQLREAAWIPVEVDLPSRLSAPWKDAAGHAMGEAAGKTMLGVAGDSRQ